MTKQTANLAPRKPIVAGPTGTVSVNVIPSRLEVADGFTPIGENCIAKMDADGILTIRIDTAARLGRTGKGLGPNLSVASTGGAIPLGMSGRLTLTAYELAGFPDERPKGAK